MNNTKWNEIFKTFYRSECESKNSLIIRWRTKDIENGYISKWDASWTHFGCEPREWDKIDYLQIELTEENKDFVIDCLRKIHVPGILDEHIVTIYGYRMDIDYIEHLNSNLCEQ